MKEKIIFDKEYPQGIKDEGAAVAKAVMTGKCNSCKYIHRCENDINFKFPDDAPCMKILRQSKN